MASIKRRYGWIPDLPDLRDQYLPKVSWLRVSQLPDSVDLRPQMPPVYDQGQLGSCVSNGVAGAMQFLRMKEKLPDFNPSRLFIYYNGRVLENTVDHDSGLQVRDGVKVASQYGSCPEAEWPYDVSQMATKPTDACYTDAKSDLVISYQRVDQNLNAMKATLNEGLPFVFGFTVYDSFESDAVASTGIVPIPASTENVLGGHCVVGVGYDDSSQCFIVRNSWGPDWGLSGYCMMPYAFLENTDLCSDFWVIQAIGGGS